MKREYIKLEMEVVELKQCYLLAGSGEVTIDGNPGLSYDDDDDDDNAGNGL